MEQLSLKPGLSPHTGQHVALSGLEQLLRRDVALAKEYFQAGGLRMVVSKALSRLRKLS